MLGICTVLKSKTILSQRCFQRTWVFGFRLTLKTDFTGARSIRKASKCLCCFPFPLFTLEDTLMFPCSLQIFHRCDRRALHYLLLASRTVHIEMSHQTWSISKLVKSYGKQNYLTAGNLAVQDQLCSLLFLRKREHFM